jgi:ribonuclease HII
MDSPDNVPKKFALRIMKYMKSRATIVAANKADDTYVIVGAASIIAKVTRDREIEKIKKVFLDEIEKKAYEWSENRDIF